MKSLSPTLARLVLWAFVACAELRVMEPRRSLLACGVRGARWRVLSARASASAEGGSASQRSESLVEGGVSVQLSAAPLPRSLLLLLEAEALRAREARQAVLSPLVGVALES